ncbi:hypothetical protein ACLK2H_07040 [Escherichia coli]
MLIILLFDAQVEFGAVAGEQDHSPLYHWLSRHYPAPGQAYLAKTSHVLAALPGLFCG